MIAEKFRHLENHQDGATYPLEMAFAFLQASTQSPIERSWVVEKRLAVPATGICAEKAAAVTSWGVP